MENPILDTYSIKYLLVFTNKDGDKNYKSEYEQSFLDLQGDSGENLESDAQYLFDTMEEAEKELHSKDVEDDVREHNEEYTSDDIEDGILIVNAEVMEVKITIQVYDPQLNIGQNTLILNKTF